MDQNSPCAICPNKHECRDKCPVIKEWLKNKRLAEKLLDEDMPLKLLGMEIENFTFH